MDLRHPCGPRPQPCPSPVSLDPVPGPSWLPGWLLALAFTPKGATHKQEMLPDVMPALGAVASPQAEGLIQAAVLTGPTSCGGGGALEHSTLWGEQLGVCRA